jgi:hypothetical protein
MSSIGNAIVWPFQIIAKGFGLSSN